MKSFYVFLFQVSLLVGATVNATIVFGYSAQHTFALGALVVACAMTAHALVVIVLSDKDN